MTLRPARAVLHGDDVGGEIVSAGIVEERAADRVRVDRHAFGFERADFLRVKTAAGDDADAGKISASSAARTLRTSCMLTPVGVKVPIIGTIEASTSVPDVSSRTPHSRSPSARATQSDVPTQSLSKSTSAMTLTAGSMY